MFAVRRSAWRMWGVSLLGVPLVVVAVDVLTSQRLTTVLRLTVFGTDDAQVIEPRDQLWAGTFGVVGAILVLWGILELVRPRSIVTADGDGITLAINGPFRAPTPVGWQQIDDLGAGVVDDSGTQLPVLWVKTIGTDVFPERPWGARFVDPRTLAVLAADWEIGPTEVAEKLVAIAIEAAAEESQDVLETEIERPPILET